MAGQAGVGWRAGAVATCIAVLAVAVGPTSVDASHIEPFDYASFPDVDLSDAAWDPVSGLVLISTQASDTRYPSSLVGFYPGDGSIAYSIAIGGSPGRIALADDGSRAYVTDIDAGHLTEVDLVGRSVSGQHSFGSGPHGERHPMDAVVVPGSPGMVLVALGYVGLRHAGVALLVDGVVADDVSPDGIGGLSLAITGVGTAVVMNLRDRDLFHLTFGGAGVVVDALPFAEGVGSGYAIQGIQYDAGEIITSTGVVIDVESGTQLGVYGDERSVAEGPVYDDQRLYIRDRFSGGITVYDRSNREQVGAVLQLDEGRSSNGGLLLTNAGPLAWDFNGFIPAAGLPVFEVFGDVDIDLGDSGYYYTGPPIDICVDVWDANSEEYLFTVESLGGGDYQVLMDGGPEIKILLWDCFGFGLFPQWYGGTVLADWDGAQTIDTHHGGTWSIDVALDPFFVDVPFDAYYFGSTLFLRNAGITTGCRALFYCPADFVTREQMAAFVARFWRVFDGECSGDPSPFDDVPAWSFAYYDVGCIADLGVTNGTGPDRYSPADSVTREQMAAFIARLWRAFGHDCPDGEHPFTDVPESSFASEDVACIFLLGITTGTTATTYSPGDLVTRAQMAAFLERLYDAILDAA